MRSHYLTFCLSVTGVLLASAMTLYPQSVSANGAQTHWVNDDVASVVEPGASCGAPGYTAIQDAVDVAAAGDTIRVCPGTYAGAVIDREVHLIGIGGATIDTGPFSHPPLLRAAFLFEDATGSGSSITGFSIVGATQFAPATDDGAIDFGVFSRGGASDVAIEKNSFSDMLQGVTAWNGTGWSIRFNDIEGLWTRCGGGIGIIVGGFDGSVITGHTIAHNSVSGMLQVGSSDCGGYDGSGVVLYSDHRWGRSGAAGITDNMIDRNRIDLESDTPGLVDVNALELTVAVDDLETVDTIITDNEVAKNQIDGAPGIGIAVTAGVEGNLLTQNQVNNATEWSCSDDSVGPGTEGTANEWDRNRADSSSSPTGICD